MAKSLVTIKIDPYTFQTVITGEFVAGAEHYIVLRNEKGEWEGSEWQLTIKEVYSGDVWAYGEDLEIDSEDSNKINGILNLNQTPVWDAIDDQKEVSALLEFQEISGDDPIPYNYPQEITIYNTTNRSGDIPPLPPDTDEFEDGQGLVLDKDNNKWVPADVVIEPDTEENWKAWYNGEWKEITQVNGGEV